MLIMINAYHFNASESHVINSLETFTGWCEQGDEVHVAVDTASPHLAPYVFAAKQRFFCQRLGASLPLIVSEYDPTIKLRIAGVHRELVAAKLDLYDWFLYAEDDLALRTHHIKYLQRWTPRLAQKGMLPHLMRYEVASLRGISAVNADGERAAQARPSASQRLDAMILDEYPFPIKLSSFHRRQHTLVHVDNPYMAMWFLPRELLRPHVAIPSWLDEVRRHADRNLRVHFATFWLLSHYNFAVPLQAFADALVHHVSTHYADIGLAHVARQRRDRRHPFLLHRYFSHDAWDLHTLLRDCVGWTNHAAASTSLGPDTTKIAHVEFYEPGRCAACLKNNRNVTVSVSVWEQGAPAEVSVTCL